MSVHARHGSDTARALHQDSPAIDLHADALMWARAMGYDVLKRHEPPLPYAWLGGHVDVPRLIEGGLGAQFFSLVSLPYLDPDVNDACHVQIDLLERAIAASHGKLIRATTARAVDEAKAQGAIAALLGIEGAHALCGELDALDVFAARGVRYLGLLHFSANECGAPAGGLGADDTRGLTPFGREVVRRAESLGVIVDLAHINRRGFFDAIETARRPLIVSHTGIAGVHASFRNIDDDQIRAVADTGGCIGVMFCPQFLGGGGIDAVVDHLMHIVDVAGEDVPSLGSDWDGFIRPTRGLEDASKLPCLTDALLARGMSQRAVAKLLRENALRVLREIAP